MTAIVVNFFGGPGAGKSTLALGVASKLKQAGINCEYVHEFAKELTWDRRFDAMKNQTWILGSQYEMLRRCIHQVDVIVTDTSLLNSALYGQKLPFSDKISDLAISMFNSMDNLTFVVDREKEYNPVGRSQNEEQAIAIDQEVRGFLRSCLLHGYYNVPGSAKGEEIVLEKIKQHLADNYPF
jgi:nicotinamide riboside kinase